MFHTATRGVWVDGRFVSSSTRVGFGAHRNESYLGVLLQHPQYARWVVMTFRADGDDCNSRLRDYARWLIAMEPEFPARLQHRNPSGIWST